MTPRQGRRALGRYLPRQLRVEVYHLRRLGPKGYARRKWREHARGPGQEPRANAPFEIGAGARIVLHDSTVAGVRTHWVDRGEGTRELDAFRRLAPGHSTFLDIGAARGLYSAAFCALTDGRAYAFEPSPAMFQTLGALIELNPDFDIKPFEIALGDAPGSRAVESRGEQFRGVRSGEANAETMTVDTLDAFVAHHELAPDFVKIDVEGMELEVLRGGAQTFGGPVDAVMLEVHPRILMQGEGVSGIHALLAGFGFALFTLDFEPISDLERHLGGARGLPARAANVVCQRSPERRPS
jgi:FkbM family methyltransferase